MVERLVIRMPLWGWVALATLAALALASGVFAVRERQRSRTAERNALRDPLTGVGNRLAFDHQLAIAWERAKRYDEGLGVLVLDLDGFKRVNDAGGHLAGDNVLRKVGKVIASRSRRSDVTARLGGDEFALLTSADSRPSRRTQSVTEEERDRREPGLCHPGAPRWGLRHGRPPRRPGHVRGQGGSQGGG